MSHDESSESKPSKSGGSFWTTLPGILTGCAALITAIGGVLGTLVALGIITPATEPTATPPAAPTLVATRAVTLLPPTPPQATPLPAPSPTNTSIAPPTSTPTPTRTPTPTPTPAPPAAPSNLAAAVASQTSMQLKWIDNANNESGFYVYQAGVAAPVATAAASAGAGGTLIATVGNLQCGVSYSFTVRAYHATGLSASSNTATNATTCQVIVTFTEVTIHEDTDAPTATDPLGRGELWFDFDVNGTVRRWPSSGTESIGSGERKTLNVAAVSLNLTRSQSLTIAVKGADNDTSDADDSLGTVKEVFVGSNRWSEGGPYCKRSSSPNYFTICFKIDVNP